MLCSRLKDLRLYEDWTQQEVANMINCHLHTYGYSLDTTSEYLCFGDEDAIEAPLNSLVLGKLQLINDDPLKTKLLVSYIDMIISLHDDIDNHKYSGSGN